MIAGARWLLLVVITICAPLLQVVLASGTQTSPARVPSPLLTGLSGSMDGLAANTAGQLELTGNAAAWSDEPFLIAGVLVSDVVYLLTPSATFLASWLGEAPPGTAVRLEVRGRTDATVTPWEEAPAGGGLVSVSLPVSAVQYRITLLSRDAVLSPQVSDVRLAVVEEEPTLTAGQAAPASMNFRLYATRIGLIGSTTANGTVVAPEDRFVALPSRRVLAAKGGREYEVRIEYKGRSVTAPVWDIGPWNVRDNYWDAPAKRDMWNDLPMGRPQSASAYFDAYHGGRDGFGRRVLSPASIDISDAAFYDLGMTNADWVQVTLLWPPRR